MKRFVEAFAQSGDKTEVPNTTQGDGSVSYPTGYGPDYEKNLDSDPEAKRIERQKMNQVFFDVTESIKLWQEQGHPMFVSAADNGGAAMLYRKGMKVVFNDGNLYQSLIDNNDGVPATDRDKWSQVSGIDGEYVSGGTYKVGDIVTASDGNQYWCNVENNGSSPVEPVGDITDTWRRYPSFSFISQGWVVESYFTGKKVLSVISSNFDTTETKFPLPESINVSRSFAQLTHQGTDVKSYGYSLAANEITITSEGVNSKVSITIESYP